MSGEQAAHAPTRCPRCHGLRDATASGELCPLCVLTFALEDEPDPAHDEPPVFDAPAGPSPSGGVPFGEYVLLDEIGRGGAGVVYRAWQPRLKRNVALKTLSNEQHDTAEARHRFRREAELTAALDHRAILPIHEVGELDGTPYYTAKLAEGGSLAARVAALRGRYGEIARLVATLARGIDHAHSRGVLHRDLKPSNVVFDGAGHGMIVDFGLARQLVGDSSVTASGILIGTPRYIAPEAVVPGVARPDTAIDIYGLGAILYELLTGEAPFSDLTPLQLLRQAGSRTPRRPRHIDTTIPRALETICLRCLEKRPSDRFPSAGALADALEASLREGLREGNDRRGAWRSMLPSRRRAWLRWLAAASLACLIAAIVIMAQRGVFSATPDPGVAARRVIVLPGHPAQPSRAELAAVRALATALPGARPEGLASAESGHRGGRGRLRQSPATRGIRLGAFTQVQVFSNDDRPDPIVNVRVIDVLRGERIWQGQAEASQLDALAKRLAPVLADRQTRQARDIALPREALGEIMRGDALVARFESGANDAAIEAYQRAIAAAPGSALAHARLSAAYARRGNRFGGAAFWNDSAIEEAERAIRLDPTLASGSGALGFAYYNKGWWQRATAAYERAMALGLVGSQSNLALIYYGTGRFEEAFRLYLQDLEFAPDNRMTLYLAAQTLLTLGATDAGERWMRAAMSLESNADKRQLMEAEIALYRDNYAQCRALAGPLDPDLVSGGFGAANDIARTCAERQHDWPAALALLAHEKQRYATGTGDLGNAGPALEEAVLLEQMGRHAAATPVLAAAHRSAQAAIDSGREYPKVWLRMAAVLRLQGDIDGAYRMLEEAFAHGLTINARNADDFEFLPFLGDARFAALRDASHGRVERLRTRVEASLRVAEAAPRAIVGAD